MSRPSSRSLPAVSLVLAAICSTPLIASSSTRAADEKGASRFDIDGEDYRLFCGYLDALENPKVAKLTGKKRDAQIARMAKLPVKKLMSSVEKAKKHGATCDEIGKLVEADAKKAVAKAMPGRVDVFIVDYSDPSHVVISVTWLGGDMKKVVQEGVALASALAESAPVTRTIALRAVNPGAPDREADAAIWFEARMSAERASNIDRARIKDFADSRYIRLFDGVRCGADVAGDTVLGYKRGPCEGKGI